MFFGEEIIPCPLSDIKNALSVEQYRKEMLILQCIFGIKIWIHYLKNNRYCLLEQLQFLSGICTTKLHGKAAWQGLLVREAQVKLLCYCNILKKKTTVIHSMYQQMIFIFRAID